MTSDQAAKETGRVEAFSDGVFAIAITLLGMTLEAPAGAGEHLAASLLELWPALVAFAISFVTVGIMWINHHRLFTHIRRVDHGLLLLNGLLLMTVALVPFATQLLARYLGRPGGQTATTCYSGVFVAVTLAFNAMWRYSAHRHRLLDPAVEMRTIHQINLQYGFGPVLYLASLGIALVSVWASLAVNMGLAAFFALPKFEWGGRPRPGSKRGRRAAPTVGQRPMPSR